MKFISAFSSRNSGESKAVVTFNGDKSQNNILPGKILVKKLSQKPVTNNLIVENVSDNPLYVNIIKKGIPMVSDETKAEKGLSMKVSYLDMTLKPIDKSSLEQGSDFIMTASITNSTINKVDNIALTEMVPSGWEIQNTRMFEANYGIKEGWFDYRDFRDDRVNTYFGLNPGETKTFVLILNAAYKGEFYQPAVWCEAMYSANLYSRVPGNKVSVIGPAVEQ
jgi:hypothetical protein